MNPNYKLTSNQNDKNTMPLIISQMGSNSRSKEERDSVNISRRNSSMKLKDKLQKVPSSRQSQQNEDLNMVAKNE